jgi:hypothetical protein
MPTLRKGLDFFFLMPWQLPMDPWILISTSCVILSLYLELHIFPTPNSSHYTLDILLLDLQFPPWFLPLRHCHLRHLPFSLVINLAPSCLYNNSRDNVTQLLSPFRTTDTMHDSMTIPRNTIFHFTPLRYCLLNDLQLLSQQQSCVFHLFSVLKKKLGEPGLEVPLLGFTLKIRRYDTPHVPVLTFRNTRQSPEQIARFTIETSTIHF